MKKITQAVILAGGMGTRMRPLSLTTPKPMIFVNGKPFLEYVLESLVRNGIQKIVILVGYKSEQIKAYFKNGKKFGVNITYSDSGIDANTGKRLKDAMLLLDNTFLLLYGDNYWPLRLNELTDYWKSKNTEALVSVYSNIDNYTKSNMYVHEGIVEVYDKKRELGKELNGVDIGFFILQKKHIDLLPTVNGSFEEIVIPHLIARKQLAGYLTHHRYYGLSNPSRLTNIEKYFKPKKVVFLDRDGVINKKAPEGEYIRNWQEFEFLPGTIKTLQLLSKRNYEIYIVTNQAGIARGKMTKSQVDEIHDKLRESLLKKGVTVMGIYMCPHGWNEGCFCRKPNPGMFFQAASEYALNLFDSICIGDDARDMEAAKNAGVNGYQVTSQTSFYDIVRSIL